MTSHADSFIESLRASGYIANIEAAEGGIERVHVGGSQLDYYITDLSIDQRQYMRDATASIAVLAFDIGDASPMSARFMAELLKLVAPADKLLRKQRAQPLIRTTAATLHAIYQTDVANVGLYIDELPHLGRPLFGDGLSFADSNAAGTLRADCGPVALDGGSWLADRSPLNIPRAELPMWDGEGISKKLRALVDRWVTAGEVREPEPYRAPQPKPDFSYGELDISVDPEFWDATDARRNLPGVAEEVRRLREARGLKRWE